MAHTGRYGGSERWQGTVIIENGKCRLPVFFFYGTNWSPAVNSGQRGPWSYVLHVNPRPPLYLVTTSELMTFFNISGPGEFCRRFAKFIVNISQRHREHVSIGMLYGLKTCFTWMACFSTAAISYLIEKSRIDLNVTFRDQRYAFGVG